MKNVILGLAMCAVILFSCQQQNRADQKQEAPQKNMLSSEKMDSNQRQFIHTASIDMAVNNCLNTTNLIEQQAIASKGFVLKSELKKNVNQQIESVISSDSIKQLTYYNTHSDIIIRVPDTSLQSFLQYTQSLSTHVKTRLINADDVSFDLKLNLLNLQSGEKQKVISNDKENDIQVQKTLTKNEAIVENMKMKDAIHFSTVSIALQQPEEILSTVMINNSAAWAKETSILNKAWYSLQKGFYYFSSLIIFLLQLWWLLPLYFVGKYVFVKSKKMFFNKV